MKTGDVRRRALLGGAVALVMAVSGCAGSGAVSRGGKGANGERRPSGPDAASPRPLPSASPTPAAVGFDKTAQSTDDPVSSWVVVNKSRPLNPIAYEPPDLVYPDVTFVNRQPLRAEAATALVALFQAGKAEAGLDFSVQSAYRSYDSQVRVYGYEAARSGVASADAGTARPGPATASTRSASPWTSARCPPSAPCPRVSPRRPRASGWLRTPGASASCSATPRTRWP
ncbi:transcription termination factor Rho [Leifsonia xyli subsp. cynodontis DSM 46306]|uniref:D-alanyl-D-alanine carboxypeptidase-like core domain-containing protein n=1 Tax=Leifsonia xyli subsp. cynodontis DSM 46306 TaxID=1389489 RepID=U3PFR2_LEIXC|nr:transcription termination factor Rho [Leifsonia xyli subsp. cynodontis DSM 46306]